jgi:putative transposase
MQQARNAAMWMDDEGIRPRFILYDYDTKYTVKFDDFFRRIVKEQAVPQKGQVTKSMIRIPQMNGYAESFVATIKRECLNHFRRLKELRRIAT